MLQRSKVRQHLFYVEEIFSIGMMAGRTLTGHKMHIKQLERDAFRLQVPSK
ncbi:MAG: hypothetical protein ABW034_13145 [Steroidobacteraceae bacterium]